jgi:predicted transcriptional regulator
MKTEYDDIRLAIACDRLRKAIDSHDTTPSGLIMAKKGKTLYTLTTSGAMVIEDMRKVERY